MKHSVAHKKSGLRARPQVARASAAALPPICTADARLGQSRRKGSRPAEAQPLATKAAAEPPHSKGLRPRFHWTVSSRGVFWLLIVFALVYTVSMSADPKAYVINGGSPALTVIDLGTRSLAGNINTGGGGSELYVMIDNRYALLTEPGDNVLRKLDLWGASPGVSTASVALPASPGSIIVNLRQNSIWNAYAYVASETSNSVSIVAIDESVPASLTLVKTITGFNDPVQVNQSLDGKYLYVVNAAPSGPAGFISVVDTSGDPASQSVTATVPLPAGHPNQFAMHASGKAFITAPDAGMIYAFNPATNSIDLANSIDFHTNTPIARPGLVVFSPDSTLMFVLDQTGWVYVLKLSPVGNVSYAGAFDVGINPVDMAVTSDNKYAYVACQSGEVDSIDMSTGLTNIQSGPVTSRSGTNYFVGKQPVGVQFDANENYAYVVLGGANAIAVIDPNNEFLNPPTISTGNAPVGMVQLNQPYVYPGGVVNGASFAPNTPAAMGAIVSIFGEGLVETGGAADPAQYPPLPTSIGDTQVLFNGIAAPLFYTSGTQINAIVPNEMALLASATMRVLGPNGEDLQTVPLASANPGLFTYPPGGVGDGIIQNGVAPYNLINSSTPAVAGGYIVIYGAGFGTTNPLIADGYGLTNPSGAPLTATDVTLKINGQTVRPAYIGAAGYWAGLYQINVQVPQLAAGKYPVSVTINGNTSNSVNLYVK